MWCLGRRENGSTAPAQLQYNTICCAQGEDKVTDDVHETRDDGDSLYHFSALTPLHESGVIVRRQGIYIRGAARVDIGR